MKGECKRDSKSADETGRQRERGAEERRNIAKKGFFAIFLCAYPQITSNCWSSAARSLRAASISRTPFGKMGWVLLQRGRLDGFFSGCNMRAIWCLYMVSLEFYSGRRGLSSSQSSFWNTEAT